MPSSAPRTENIVAALLFTRSRLPGNAPPTGADAFGSDPCGNYDSQRKATISCYASGGRQSPLDEGSVWRRAVADHRSCCLLAAPLLGTHRCLHLSVRGPVNTDGTTVEGVT